MMRPALILLIVILLAAGCVTPGNRASGSGPLVEVPRMTDLPRFDGVVSEAEWAGAVLTNGSFEIADGSRAQGVYPFVLRAAATRDALLLAVEVHNRTPNPFGGGDSTFADQLHLFFSTSGEAELVPPSFWIASATYPGSVFTGRGFWNGAEWEIDPGDEGLTLDEGQPRGGTWVKAHAGNGTTSFEVHTPRIAKGSQSSLQLTRGASFSLCLAYMRQGDIGDASRGDSRGVFQWPHDTFPSEGYTPHGMYDVRGWLNFRVE